MLHFALRVIDWFIPERAKRSKSDLRPGAHIRLHPSRRTRERPVDRRLSLHGRPVAGLPRPVIALGIALSGCCLSSCASTGNLRLVAVDLRRDADRGDAVWRLLLRRRQLAIPAVAADRAAQRLLLSQRPAVQRVGLISPSISRRSSSSGCGGRHFPTACRWSGCPSVGIVSVASATLYMAGSRSITACCLASESALQREVLRHRQTAERLRTPRTRRRKPTRTSRSSSPR